jgi:hypothetical protein
LEDFVWLRTGCYVDKACENAMTMKRQFFSLSAAISLLLSTVVGIMWMRSYVTTDMLFRSGSWVGSDGGHLPRWLESSDGSLSWRYYPRDDDAPRVEFDHSILGFRYYFGHDRQPPGTGTYFSWVVFAAPYWFVFALAAGPAVRELTRRRIAYSRRRRNRCVNCGYDLRATPSRCPECGALRERGNRRWFAKEA